MFKINRLIVYGAYGLLTTAAFAADEYYDSEVSIGLATNLLAGLVVVAFIDTLNRMAEEHRRRPILLATMRVNSVTCSRLYHLLRVLAEHASIFHQDDEILASLAQEYVPNGLGLKLSAVPSQHKLPNGEPLLKSLHDGSRSVLESAEKALERYGGFQEPANFFALARLEDGSPLQLASALYAHNPDTNTTLPPDMWSVLIEVHNTLRGNLDRAAARHGYDPRRPL